VHEISIIPSARKDLDDLDKKVFAQIKNKIISLASNPRPSFQLISQGSPPTSNSLTLPLFLFPLASNHGNIKTTALG